MGQVQRIALGVRIPMPAGKYVGCSSRFVPAPELIKVAFVGVRDRGDEVIAGDRLSIMASEIKVHSAPKTRLPNEGLQHPDDFRAFFIHRNGVEIVDFLVAVRSDGMCHWARVLCELLASEKAHIFDALDGAGTRDHRIRTRGLR